MRQSALGDLRHHDAAARIGIRPMPRHRARAAGFLRNLDNIDDLQGMLMQPAKPNTFPRNDGDGYSPSCAYTGQDTATTVSGVNSYVPHLAEGVDANAHSEFTCASAAGMNDLLAPQTAIVHQLATTAADARTIHTAGSLVSWAPRSNISLYGNTAPVTLLNALGVPIALGTDWIVSGSATMLRELKCADSFIRRPSAAISAIFSSGKWRRPTARSRPAFRTPSAC
jgi:hypothetical protein